MATSISSHEPLASATPSSSSSSSVPGGGGPSPSGGPAVPEVGLAAGLGAVAAACVLAVALAGIAMFWLHRRRRRQQGGVGGGDDSVGGGAWGWGGDGGGVGGGGWLNCAAPPRTARATSWRWAGGGRGKLDDVDDEAWADEEDGRTLASWAAPIAGARMDRRKNAQGEGVGLHELEPAKVRGEQR